VVAKSHSGNVTQFCGKLKIEENLEASANWTQFSGCSHDLITGNDKIYLPRLLHVPSFVAWQQMILT